MKKVFFLILIVLAYASSNQCEAGVDISGTWTLVYPGNAQSNYNAYFGCRNEGLCMNYTAGGPWLIYGTDPDGSHPVINTIYPAEGTGSGVIDEATGAEIENSCNWVDGEDVSDYLFIVGD